MGTAYQYPFGGQQNQLLTALPQEDLNRWRSQWKLVELSRNQVLNCAGRAPEYVYFPTTAIVSLMSITQDGASAEVAVVGNEGVVGISALLGADSAETDAVVQSAGHAMRMSTRFVKGEIAQDFGIMKVVMRYAQSVMAQMAQMAVCNRHHSVDQQFCRRLLLGLDRLPSDELDMTQELAANLLGVRRESVTAAAHKLQEAGCIHYHRGHIVVLNRQRLEQMACECYASTSKEYRRLLPQAFAA